MALRSLHSWGMNSPGLAPGMAELRPDSVVWTGPPSEWTHAYTYWVHAHTHTLAILLKEIRTTHAQPSTSEKSITFEPLCAHASMLCVWVYACDCVCVSCSVICIYLNLLFCPVWRLLFGWYQFYLSGPLSLISLDRLLCLDNRPRRGSVTASDRMSSSSGLDSRVIQDGEHVSMSVSLHLWLSPVMSSESHISLCLSLSSRGSCSEALQ